MGQDSSKPSSPPSQHVFQASGAQTTFSGDLVGSLQNSTQSDATRDANLELKIQNRVTSELERLAKEETAKLESAAEQASSEADSSKSSPTIVDRLTGEAAEKERKAQLSRNGISKEIAELKKKLEGRKRLEQPDPGVERAQEELVQCLRMNDRRPLDCWQEREAFKREVGRLEREFVERAVR